MADSNENIFVPLLKDVEHTTQIVRPYSAPFSFDDIGLGYDNPVAPLATTGYLSNGDLGIRCVFFIENTFIVSPWVTHCGTGVDGSGEENVLFIVIEYMSHGEGNPNHYMFLSEINIEKDLVDFDTICTVVVNKDPKTSRGTYTSVPEPKATGIDSVE